LVSDIRQEETAVALANTEYRRVISPAVPPQENRQPPADQTTRELERYWPTYKKNEVSAADLRERFSISDLHRVARFDKNLLMLLRKLASRMRWLVGTFLQL
jgi:hypothetical protein